jgi:hypothetical protein
MIRRSFFQTLAATLLPKPVVVAAETPPLPCGQTARNIPNQFLLEDPDWLRTWKAIPRVEMSADILSCRKDPHLLAVAAFIMPHIAGGIPVRFRYVGGSEPGTVRTVLPTSFFYLDYTTWFHFCWDEPLPPGFPEYNESAYYLLGWCQTRQAARNFRIDRMELLETSA